MEVPKEIDLAMAGFGAETSQERLQELIGLVVEDCASYLVAGGPIAGGMAAYVLAGKIRERYDLDDPPICEMCDGYGFRTRGCPTCGK